MQWYIHEDCGSVGHTTHIIWTKDDERREQWLASRCVPIEPEEAVFLISATGAIEQTPVDKSVPHTHRRDWFA